MAIVFSDRSFSQAGDSCQTLRGEWAANGQRIGYERCLGDPAFVAVDTCSDYIKASFGLEGSCWLFAWKTEITFGHHQSIHWRTASVRGHHSTVL